MRTVFALLALVLLLFAAAQYDDPDGPLWALFYGVPAIAAGLAAYRPDRLARPAARVLLAILAAGSFALTIAFWPSAPGWWRQEVWWDSEESREGMGLMIVTAVLLAVLAWSLLSRATSASPSRR